MDKSIVISQVLTAIIHDNSREKPPLLLPLSMQLYQLREQFPFSLYMGREEMDLLKKKKKLPFSMSRERE